MSHEELVPPTITIGLLESTMKSGARGNAESLIAMAALLTLYTGPGSHRSESDIQEVRDALAYAEARALTHRHLHVFHDDVKKLMKQALRGEGDALSELNSLARGKSASAAEAGVVVWFVNHKLSQG